jgi:hypothetical protein
VSVHLADPLTDPRWEELLAADPRASLFHTPGWLQALQLTYGYQPVVLTVSSRRDSHMSAGLPVCTVKSWFGTRAVSLPFSDHCEPLVKSQDELAQFRAYLTAGTRAGRWKYAEIRPRSGQRETGTPSRDFGASASYWVHRLDLRASVEELEARCHASCIRRAVRRAQREHLQRVQGAPDGLLKAFYHLLRLTRRRHGLPAPPIAWFRNLQRVFGDRFTIHLALLDDRPIAGVATFSFKNALTYKYGGSDARLHHLGGMPFLFWNVIRDAKSRGFDVIDLGRTDREQEGLVAFKDRLGAEREPLTYYRDSHVGAGALASNWLPRVGRRVATHLPSPALAVAGRVLYRHFA